MEGEGVVALVRQDTERKKRIRQPISVPFLWEEKPGMPRKDWKIVRPSRPPPPPPLEPVKFVVSVPFKWEEKPGTPLRSFAPSSSDNDQSLPEQETIIRRCLPPPPAAAYSPIWEYDHHYHQDEDDEDEDDDDDSDDLDARDWIRELETLSSSIQTAESSSSPFTSSSSAPPPPPPSSLLANRLMPISALSSAIPMQNYPQPHSPSSSISSISSSGESDDGASSYATGSMSSPIGNNFLEQLFPLHPPATTNKSTFSAGCSGGQKSLLSPGRGVFSFTTSTEQQQQQTPKPIQRYNYGGGGGGESDSRVATRRQLTLGELIMLSRRRSYMRKAVPIDLINNSGFMGYPRGNKEGFEEHSSMGCLGGVNDRISKLLSGKRLLALRLT